MQGSKEVTKMHEEALCDVTFRVAFHTSRIQDYCAKCLNSNFGGNDGLLNAYCPMSEVMRVSKGNGEQGPQVTRGESLGYDHHWSAGRVPLLTDVVAACPRCVSCTYYAPVTFQAAILSGCGK